MLVGDSNGVAKQLMRRHLAGEFAGYECIISTAGSGLSRVLTEHNTGHRGQGVAQCIGNHQVRGNGGRVGAVIGCTGGSLSVCRQRRMGSIWC